MKEWDELKKYLTKGNIVGLIIIVAFLVPFLNWVFSINIPNAPPQPQKLYGIGDTITDGNFAYTITEASREGGTVKVKARVKNLGNKAETLYAGTMKLRDVKRNFYSHKSDGLWEGTLNPGMEVEGTITFKVPEDVGWLGAEVNTNAIGTAVADALGNDVDYTSIDIGL